MKYRVPEPCVLLQLATEPVFETVRKPVSVAVIVTPPPTPTPTPSRLPGHQPKPLQANQRLEQALSKSGESEQALQHLGLEADSLRERLSTALSSNARLGSGDGDGEGNGNAVGERIRGEGGAPTDSAKQDQEGEGEGGGGGGGGQEGAGNAGGGDSIAEDVDNIAAATATTATATTTADPESARATLARDLEAASSKLQEETVKLRRAEETCSDLERRLSLEQGLSRDKSEELHAEIKALLERVKGAEKGEEEAMKAAATEASRAAEVREGAEGAQTELAWLRARLAESEEESERATELKGTLEVTRDALDELRCGIGAGVGVGDRGLEFRELALRERQS